MAKPKKNKTKKTTPLAFGKWLLDQPVHLTNLLLFILLGLLLPGQNQFQILTLHPHPQPAPTPTITLPPLPPVPIKTSTLPPPDLTAKALIVLDPRSSAILSEKNPHARLLPASTTKIMTALVALDVYQLNDIITIGNANQSIGHRAQIYPGEPLYVADLIKAMLINSGNDAALALAQNYSQGYQAFLDKMNQKAFDYKLNNTHFTNVSGIETAGHYTSAYDLAQLTREALKNDFFKEVVATRSTTITNVTGTITHRLDNINQLLGLVEGVQGVKTGWTQNAGDCLVTYVVRDGNPLITVILGSQNRFGESQTLIDWAYRNHSWVEIEKILQTLGY